MLSPASLALSANHMRCSDPRGSPWLAAPPHPPAAPCSPPQPSQPVAAGCRAWNLVCLLLLRAPADHLVFASAPKQSKIPWKSPVILGLCGTERAPGSLQSPSHLLVFRHQLNLPKRRIFLVNWLLPQPLPCPCLQPLLGCLGVPKATSGDFLLSVEKVSSSASGETPAKDHGGRPFRSSTAQGQKHLLHCQGSLQSGKTPVTPSTQPGSAVGAPRLLLSGEEGRDQGRRI